MNNDVIKVIAKYNALLLAAAVLDYECQPADTLGDLECLPDGLTNKMETEVNRLITSLRKRAEKLNAKLSVDIPDFVAESQRNYKGLE